MRKSIIKAAAAVMLCAAFSLNAMGATPESVKIMRYDGTAATVDITVDPVMEMILENIESKLGEKGLAAYLAAVETGNYSDFYTIQGSTKPTYENADYMTNRNGIDLSKLYGGNPLTYPQRIERCCKLSAGKNGTIAFSRVRTLAMEAGYSGTNQSAYRDIKNITGIDAYAAARAAEKVALPDSIHVVTDEDIEKLGGGR